VALMRRGVLQQVDTPLNLYDQPENVFVAGFIGSPAMNLFEGTVEGESAVSGGLQVPLSPTARERLGGDKTVTIGVRPEEFRVLGEGEKGLDVTVELVEELGADAYLYGLQVGNEDPDAKQIVARVDTRRGLVTGGKVTLGADLEKVHVFAGGSGARLTQ
jgi:multiple sugar transport system ATP-binding protein